MDTIILKRGISFLLFFLCVQCCKSQYAVIVDVGGIKNKSLKTQIDRNARKLLTEINHAFLNKTVPTLTGIEMSDEAKCVVLALWKTSPFRSQKDEIYEDILNLNGGGMELRNIRLFMANADSSYRSQEGVIEFTKTGSIDNFHLSIGTTQYKQVMNEGKDIADCRCRETILRFVENLRTSYSRKDLDFLERAFSDVLMSQEKTNQLIKEGSTKDNSQLKIVYLKQTKSEYMRKMRVIFAANDYINIKFDDLKVVQHKKFPNYYGITIKQHWNTNKYFDDEYLFFLISFNKQDVPMIHISTLQPRFINGQEINKQELFNINSFGRLQ